LDIIKILRARVLDCLDRGFLVGYVLVQVPVKPVSAALELPVFVVLGAGAILVAIESETAEAVAVVSGVLTVTAELAADELALVLLEPKSQVNFTQITVVVWSNILAGARAITFPVQVGQTTPAYVPPQRKKQTFPRNGP
jgi:hypothetical protein